MSRGQDIPYQLRPNKFIDRQIFVDVLQNALLGVPLSNYVYISMGGKHLVDHENVYRKIGFSNLFAFDGTPIVVDRQLCNRPTDSTVCKVMNSSELEGEIDDIFNEFGGVTNFVAWIDYTEAHSRLTQLNEFSALLKKSRPGDLVRITMNADIRTFRDKWDKKLWPKKDEWRANELKNQIDEYFDDSVKKLDSDLSLSIALAKAVALASQKAKDEMVTPFDFHPILLTTYADGLRMFTVLVQVAEIGDVPTTNQAEHRFYPSDWSDVLNIVAPDLSLKEKVEIDKHLSKSPDQILASISFTPTGEQDQAEEAIKSYQNLHRYYPTFYAIGIQ